MSGEQQFYLDSANGTEQFSLVPWVSDDPYPECDFCHTEKSHWVISKMIRTYSYPPPIIDRPMKIGLCCIRESVHINPVYISIQMLNKCLDKNIVDLIYMYL